MPPRGESSSSSVRKWSALVMHFHDIQNKFQQTILLICVSFVPKKGGIHQKIFRTLKPPFSPHLSHRWPARMKRTVASSLGVLPWNPSKILLPISIEQDVKSTLYLTTQRSPTNDHDRWKKKEGKLCDNHWIGGLWTISGHIYVFFSTGKIQLMASCWCGARWFGFFGIPLSNNPFYKGIRGIQTTNPN